MLQRRRCDLFIDSPKARRLSRRHGEIRQNSAGAERELW
jgi:hypothetical protein